MTELLSLEKIGNIVAKHSELELCELRGNKTRQEKFKTPRQIAFYFSYRCTRKSYAKIGAYFGSKEHATVMYGIDVVKKMVVTNDPIYMKIFIPAKKEIQELIGKLVVQEPMKSFDPVI